MASDEMESLVRERHAVTKIRERNQVPYALALLAAALLTAALLWRSRNGYVVFWAVGIALGFVLRNSRFCFAAAFRDPFLIGNTRLMRALLLSLMISSTGFAAIQFEYLKNHPAADYNDIPGIINSVGLHTVIGAFLFGVGMVLAGGCASSVLMRIGEGHALPLVTLLGFMIGTTLGAKNYPFWYQKIIKNTAVVYFPDYIPAGAALILQIAVLAGLYWFASWYQKKNSKV